MRLSEYRVRELRALDVQVAEKILGCHVLYGTDDIAKACPACRCGIDETILDGSADRGHHTDYFGMTNTLGHFSTDLDEALHQVVAKLNEKRIFFTMKQGTLHGEIVWYVTADALYQKKDDIKADASFTSSILSEALCMASLAIVK